MRTVTATGEGALTRRHLARIPIAFGLPAVLLFGAAGTLDWPAAWAYLALLMAGGAAAIVVFTRWQPELVRERAEHWRDGKSWDKPFLLMLGVVGPASVQVVCGLDRRFRWSPDVADGIQALGAVLIVTGTAVVAWAMAVNPFFSAAVRIQHDRGHRVIERGPYGTVRHPGYTGMLLATAGGPILLGAVWGLVPAALLMLTIAVRTMLEDRTLLAELPGYEAYAHRVRSRLVPSIW